MAPRPPVALAAGALVCAALAGCGGGTDAGPTTATPSEYIAAVQRLVEPPAQLASSLEERGRAVTGAAVARAADAGVTAEAVVADRKVVDLLLDLADEHSARAIVVGTYGESPLRGAVLGSTPHKLLHLSRVPVLAVPAGRTSAG